MTKETVMDANLNKAGSPRPSNGRPNSTERRALLAASLANQQAKLKQEAADRRARRASEGAEARPRPRGW